MKSLPRVLAVTTDSICRAPDFLEKIAALAAVGPRLGIVVRAPHWTAMEYVSLVNGVSAARRAGGSALFVHGRPDVAEACHADGLLLRQCDLSPADARAVFQRGWIGASVHSREEAEAAIESDAGFVVAGTVFESSSHPGRPGRGINWLRGFKEQGAPVFAIGGISLDRLAAVREAGAAGVAVISAVWDQPSPEAAARAMIEAWEAPGEEVQLTVNGEPRRMRGPATLEHLLRDLELDARAVVVELNRKIVRRPELAGTTLHNGDAVELVHFVGGG